MRAGRSFVTLEDPCNKAPLKKLQMKRSKIQIQVLGLRDLVKPSPLMGGLTQPLLEISCDDPSTAQTTKASKQPSPENANFLECLEIEVRSLLRWPRRGLSWCGARRSAPLSIRV